MIDDETIVRNCARTAARSRLASASQDDALQAGRIALWEAERDGRIPADPEHSVRYRYRRALGAMLDQARAERMWHGQGRGADFSNGMPVICCGEFEDTEPDPGSDPARQYQVVEAVAVFSQRATRHQVECMTRLANGETEGELARSMGCTTSAISQLKAACRRLLANIL